MREEKIEIFEMKGYRWGIIDNEIPEMIKIYKIQEVVDWTQYMTLIEFEELLEKLI